MRQQRTFVKFLVILSSFLLMVSFQNCSPAKFQEEIAILGKGAGDLDSSTEPLPEGTDQDSVAGDFKIKSRKWTLDQVLSDGEALAIGDRKFSWQFINELNIYQNVSCAGSCGRAFKIQGVSFCGAIHGVIEESFDEDKGVNNYRFIELDAASSDSSCPAELADLNDALIDSLKSLSSAERSVEGIIISSKDTNMALLFIETHAHQAR